MKKLRSRLRVPRVLLEWLDRFFEVQGIERSIVLASQAFTALFPLLIVYASIAPRVDGDNFADSIVDRFELTGSAADSVHTAFAPPDTVQGGVTFGSVLFLILAALAFTRTFQRIYEHAWRLDSIGMRGTGWGLIWLGATAIWYSVRPATELEIGPLFDTIVTLSFGAGIWILTPYLLLARRLPWQRLFPSALLTAIVMSGVSVAGLVYVPRNVASSAEQFGVIGVAFALLGWLVVLGFAITMSATGGAVLTEELERHSGWKLTQYLTLKYEQPKDDEHEEENGAEDRPHGGERSPGEHGEHPERGGAPHGT